LFTRRSLLGYWNELRPYFIFAVILFFAGIVVGGATSSANDWLLNQLQALSRMAENARASAHPTRAFFVTILLNNVIQSIISMYMGVAAAIWPVVMLVTNGMILGYLFGGLADHGENVGLLILKGILPHGILELPAVFLACAVGIRFGVTLLKGIWGSLLGKDGAWNGFVRTATGSVPALVVVVVMLLAAAAVESTVTNWLMR